MLNTDAKNEALEKLEKAERENSQAVEKVAEASEYLTKQRNKSASFIKKVEAYVNYLANSPRDFKKQVGRSSEAAKTFKKRYAALELESMQAFQASSATAGAGVGVGIGVAALAPSAAMGVAVTFGTASTGTAISALSGAAATNAALAWLGGGALAAGGGGMAAGNALLALAGPVGWAIGGGAIIGSAVVLANKNAEIAEEATKHRTKVVASTKRLDMTRTEITCLARQTWEHCDRGRNELNWLLENAPGDYKMFSPEERNRIGALVNHVKAMGESISQEFTL